VNDVAQIPQRLYRKWIEKNVLRQKELTLSGLLKIGKQTREEKELEELRAKGHQDQPGLIKDLGTVLHDWRCVYADPPWSYGDSKVPGGGVGHQYSTMTLDDIAALPIGDLAHPDGCHLWLWTTWPMIREQAPHKILDAWGFRWVGEIVWKKLSKTGGRFFGVGRWLRPSTEVLVLAVKGKMPLLSKKQLDTCFEQPVLGHSTKPEFFRKYIEELSPEKRIELFARRAVPGWFRWGLQA
jgi:N6-adenosine-specific RNA methylase IME4